MVCFLPIFRIKIGTSPKGPLPFIKNILNYAEIGSLIIRETNDSSLGAFGGELCWTAERIKEFQSIRFNRLDYIKISIDNVRPEWVTIQFSTNLT